MSLKDLLLLAGLMWLCLGVTLFCGPHQDELGALFDQGVYLNDEGDFESAKKVYDELIAIDSTYVRAYYNRAICWGKLGYPDSAIADYTQAIRYDSTYVNAYFNRGLILRRKSLLAESLRDFEVVYALDTNDCEALSQIGLALSDRGLLDSALIVLNKAVERDTTKAGYYNNRGEILRKLQRYGEALEDYHRAIKIDSTLPHSYHSMATLYASINDREEEGRCLRLYLKYADSTHVVRADSVREALTERGALVEPIPRRSGSVEPDNSSDTAR